MGEHRVRDREPPRGLFPIQRRFAAGVTRPDGVRCQLLGLGQGLGRTRSHRLGLFQELTKIMRRVEPHPVTHEERVERLLGSLLRVEADQIVRRHLPSEDQPGGKEILIGPGQPSEDEVPATLLRCSRTGALPR